MRQVEKWSDVTDREIEAIRGRVSLLRVDMIPVDSDGDPVVDIILIDRRKLEPMHYFPVPYRDQNEQGHEEALLSNLDLALSALQRHRAIQKIR